MGYNIFIIQRERVSFLGFLQSNGVYFSVFLQKNGVSFLVFLQRNGVGVQTPKRHTYPRPFDNQSNPLPGVKSCLTTCTRSTYSRIACYREWLKFEGCIQVQTNTKEKSKQYTEFLTVMGNMLEMKERYLNYYIVYCFGPANYVVGQWIFQWSSWKFWSSTNTGYFRIWNVDLHNRFLLKHNEASCVFEE